MPWLHRHYGTLYDPVHKSHLNALVSDYGCPRAFKYMRDAQADGLPDAEASSVSGYTAAGTATHETIARALTSPELVARILAGPNIGIDAVRRVYWDEWEREIDGRDVRWRDKDKPNQLHEARVAMIHGVLGELHKYVDRVELVEPGFIAQVGEFWLSGHIDLVYRPKSNPSALAICDWKTGATKPLEIELDHGWEAGVYGAAVHSGLFIPREAVHCLKDMATGHTTARCGGIVATHAIKYVAQRNAVEAALIEVGKLQVPELAATAVPGASELDLRAFDTYPEIIRHVHLADYVPYEKAGRKSVHRPEDLAFYSLSGPASVGYVKGNRRGPAWLPVRVTEQDVPRLESRLRNVVGMVRMGRFVDVVGEKCRRCPWAGPCLNTGYAVKGDESKRLEKQLKLSVQYEDDAAELSL